MNTIYVLCALSYLSGFGFAYIQKFTMATLALGRELSDTDSPRGFQDAVSPPWESNLGIVIYLSMISAVSLMWWHAGFLFAVGSLVVIVSGFVVGNVLLPDYKSLHFGRLIFRSMTVRYANYVRKGDVVRANAMKDLLVKSGIDPDRL